MKLTISKEQINFGLQAVQNIVSTRSTLPILSNVLLRADQNKLQIVATDLDVSISCLVAANVQVPGAITLPAKKVAGIMRELAALEIEMEVDEKNICTIQAGSSFYKMHGLPAEHFPAIPNPEGQRKIIISQEKLKSLLRKTSFAISNDESRFVLNGIFFSLKDHKITLVATDGRRLALADEAVDLGNFENADFILPTKAINEITRVLQTKGEAEISLSANQATFSLKEENGPLLVVISKLVEGAYPNYRQVIPAECKERIPLPREEFLHALRRAEIMTSDKATSVKLNFTKNNLAITANTPEVGEARESMAVNYKGPDMAVAFNPGFLMEPLKAVETDEVYLELIDELSPGVLKINGPFLYVIMPMRMG